MAGQQSGHGEDGHEDHGHTVAAWVGVGVILLGFAISAVAMLSINWTVFWIGVAVAVLGAVMGKVLSMAGLGIHAPMEQGSAADEPAAHAPGTQDASINNE